jgi:hypothetical protein
MHKYNSYDERNNFIIAWKFLCSMDYDERIYRNARKTTAIDDLRRVQLKDIEKNKPVYVRSIHYLSDEPSSMGNWLSYLHELFEVKDMGRVLQGNIMKSSQDPHISFFTYAPQTRLGKRIPLPIFVKNIAFDSFTQEEILCTLEDHEYQHARDKYYGMPVGKQVLNYRNHTQIHASMFMLIFEIRGHTTHLEGIVRRNLQNTKTHAVVESQLAYMGAILEEYNPQKKLEEEAKEVYLSVLRDKRPLEHVKC